jgi:hypothetical protein
MPCVISFSGSPCIGKTLNCTSNVVGLQVSNAIARKPQTSLCMAVQPPVKLPPIVCFSWQRTVDVFHEGGLPLDEFVSKMGDGGEVVAVEASTQNVVFERS